MDPSEPEISQISSPPVPPVSPEYPSQSDNNTNGETTLRPRLTSKMPFPAPPLVLLKEPNSQKPNSQYLPKEPENTSSWNNESSNETQKSENNNETQKRLNRAKKNFIKRKNSISFNRIDNCSFDSLIRDMLRYKTYNWEGHYGNVYAHSIWTAISIYNLLYTNQVVKGRKFVDEINLSSFDNEKKDLTILCGFLHDIGKIGDNDIYFSTKKYHPKDGFERLIGERDFLSVKDIYDEKYKKSILDYFNHIPEEIKINEEKKNYVAINIRKYLQDNCALLTNDKNYGILAISSGMHYSIGDINRKIIKNEDYIKKLFEYKKIVEEKLIIEYTEDDMKDILNICIIVSIADVIGNVEIDYKGTDKKFIFHDIKKVEDDTHNKKVRSAYDKFNYESETISRIVEYLVKSGIKLFKQAEEQNPSSLFPG